MPLPQALQQSAAGVALLQTQLEDLGHAFRAYQVWISQPHLPHHVDLCGLQLLYGSLSVPAVVPRESSAQAGPYLSAIVEAGICLCAP